MDYPLETTFDIKFFTKSHSTGAPTTLSGTPVVVIYEDNSITEITVAETLTVDFDSITGLNNLRIEATAANGFESGKSYSAVISAGTVDSVSVVGMVLCNFSIQKEYTGATTVGSSALSITADSATITTGSETGTYTNTTQLDGTYHVVEDAGGTTDFYYEFNVGGNSVPVEAVIDAYARGNNSNWLVYAYNWDGTSWDQIGSIVGTSGTVDQSFSFNMTTSHVGSGADLGKVRIRFYSTNGTDIGIDRILCSYATVAVSVGYANGAIWVDTNGSNTNTENYVDGVADNPVSTWAAALTLSSQLGIKRFILASGSSITLSSNSDYYYIEARGSTVDLNGQSINGIEIDGGRIIGNDDGSNSNPAKFNNCTLGGNTLGQFRSIQCSLVGDTIIAEAGTYILEQCFSAVAGTSTPSIDFGSGLGDTNINFRHYSGGIEIKNMGQSGIDNMSLEGFGQLIINANCAGGTLAVRGSFNKTDNSGSVSINEVARVARDSIVGYENGYIYIDTINGTAGTSAWINGTVNNPVDTFADAISISNSVGITNFYINSGSEITLTQSVDAYVFEGENWTCNLNGQSVSGTIFRNAVILGNDSGTNTNSTIYFGCLMWDNTLGWHRLNECGLYGTMTLAEGANYGYLFCHSSLPDTFPIIDFGAAIGDTNVNLSHYSGDMEFHNVGQNGTDSIRFEGKGKVKLDSSCVGGSIYIRGNIEKIDNSDGTTVNDDARIDTNQINEQCDQAISDAALATASSLATVDGNVDDIKLVTEALTVASATKLSKSISTLVQGTVSYANASATTSIFYSDDITEATADHYNGRIVIFTSGNLQNQATAIDDYALISGEGRFTVAGLTEAPADNDTFIIV